MGYLFCVERDNDNFDNENLNECSGAIFLDKLKDLKPSIILDINPGTFERKMHLVNDLLSKKNCFCDFMRKKN